MSSPRRGRYDYTLRNVRICPRDASTRGISPGRNCSRVWCPDDACGPLPLPLSPASPTLPPLEGWNWGGGKGEVLLPSFIGELGEGEGEGGRRQDLNAYIPSLIMFVCLFYPPRARYKWAVIPSRQVCFSWRRKQETNPSHASVAALSKKEDDRRFPRPLVTPPS